MMIKIRMWMCSLDNSIPVNLILQEEGFFYPLEIIHF